MKLKEIVAGGVRFFRVEDTGWKEFDKKMKVLKEQEEKEKTSLLIPSTDSTSTVNVRQPEEPLVVVDASDSGLANTITTA